MNIRFMLVAVTGLGMTPPATAADLSSLVGGCWEYHGFKTNDRKEPARTVLAHIHHICFRPDGSAEGFTFHDYDAWDWTVDYELTKTGIVVGNVPWTILAFDRQQFTIEDQTSRRIYKLICRTKAENAACEQF
ncbi:hypothetical protein [Bradyrhizobium sp. ORS 285]|uniref:hypothetical protein n=1 Tax=Bradyrhizobium sp. ORS 285 TaxID=115808 RepID=UPI001111F494|nr:hypothetical protein [Bradyrhizobium sp. ORS 285]